MQFSRTWPSGAVNIPATISNLPVASLHIVFARCANLANPVWTPLKMVTLTNRSCYFSEPLKSDIPCRFHRHGLP